MFNLCRTRIQNKMFAEIMTTHVTQMYNFTTSTVARRLSVNSVKLQRLHAHSYNRLIYIYSTQNDDNCPDFSILQMCRVRGPIKEGANISMIIQTIFTGSSGKKYPKLRMYFTVIDL